MPVLKTIGLGGTEIHICIEQDNKFCNGEVILHYFTPSFSTKSSIFQMKLAKQGFQGFIGCSP